MAMQTLEERFWPKVEKTEECWNWKASLNGRGYGQIGVVINGKPKNCVAHRIAYELVKGPIPEGLTLDHLCRNRLCVNPDHLEPVTNKENIMRGTGMSVINSKKTHCPQGHPLIKGNLIPNKLKQGVRRCLTCARIQRRASMRKIRSEGRDSYYSRNKTKVNARRRARYAEKKAVGEGKLFPLQT